MNIQTVIDRALEDPIFAAELFAKAGHASRALSEQQGDAVAFPAGDEWKDLLSEFAETPEELSQLLTPGASDEEKFAPTLTTTMTTTTTTTVTTLPCSVTTTTTTSGTTLTTTTHAIVEPRDAGE